MTGKNAAIAKALELEGMTTELGLVIMDRFLEKAVDQHPDGMCMEFGTYKGRTAALIAGHLNEDSWLHAVEQSDYLELEKIRDISPNVIWHKQKSEEFCKNTFPELAGDKIISYTHHDASHFFDNVATELEEIVSNMGKRGVMVLDDFGDTYSQVRAAYYFLRYTKNFPYELILIGFNKGILVHEDSFDYYEDYILNELLTEIETADRLFLLGRSDVNRHSRNFLLSTRKDESINKHYGVAWWGERFYEPSRTMLSDDDNPRQVA